MEKYVSYEKLSKRKQREIDSSRRGGWGGLNPVTRRPENPKAYNRKKIGKVSDSSVPDLFYCTEAQAVLTLRGA